MLQVSLKLPRKKAVVCQVTIQEMVNNDLVQVSHPQSVKDLPILPRILYLSPSNSPRSLANLAAGQPLPSKISGVTNWLMGSKVSLVKPQYNWIPPAADSTLAEVCTHGGISGKSSGSSGVFGLWQVVSLFVWGCFFVLMVWTCMNIIEIYEFIFSPGLQLDPTPSSWARRIDAKMYHGETFQLSSRL